MPRRPSGGKAPPTAYLTDGEAEMLHGLWLFQELEGGRECTGELLALQLLALRPAPDFAQFLTSTDPRERRNQLEAILEGGSPDNPLATNSSPSELLRSIVARKLLLVRKNICDVNRKGDYVTTLGWALSQDRKRTKLYGLVQRMTAARAQLILALQPFRATQRTDTVSIKDFSRYLAAERKLSPWQVKKDLEFAIAHNYFIQEREGCLDRAERTERELRYLTRVANENSLPPPRNPPLALLNSEQTDLVRAIVDEATSSGGKPVKVARLKELTGLSEISIRNILAVVQKDWPWRLVELVSGGHYKPAQPTPELEGIVDSPRNAAVLMKGYEIVKQGAAVAKKALAADLSAKTGLGHQQIEESIQFAIENLYFSESRDHESLRLSERIFAERPYLERLASEFKAKHIEPKDSDMELKALLDSHITQYHAALDTFNRRRAGAILRPDKPAPPSEQLRNRILELEIKQTEATLSVSEMTEFVSLCQEAIREMSDYNEGLALRTQPAKPVRSLPSAKIPAARGYFEEEDDPIKPPEQRKSGLPVDLETDDEAAKQKPTPSPLGNN